MKAVITVYYIRILSLILAIAWFTSIFFLGSTSFAKESFHDTRVEKELKDGSIVWSGVSSRSDKRQEHTISRADGFTNQELEWVLMIKEGKVITQPTNGYIAYIVSGAIFFPVLITLLFCALSFDPEDNAELNQHRISVYKNILLFSGYSDQEIDEIIPYLKKYISLPENGYPYYYRKGTYYRLIQLTREFLSTNKQN